MRSELERSPAPPANAAPLPQLALSFDPPIYDEDGDLIWGNWLSAIEYGRVDDGQPREHWSVVGEHFAFLHDGPPSPADASPARCVGFKVGAVSEFDPEQAEYEPIWSRHRFDVPQLGLTGASAGEIYVAALAFFHGEESLNRLYFGLATQADDPEEAEWLWRACLGCGDLMALFGLGYTLHDAGRHHEAYPLLRRYSELAPAQPWVWVWYGKAASAIGETGEARRAYETAIALSEAGGEETDAPELLAEL